MEGGSWAFFGECIGPRIRSGRTISCWISYSLSQEFGSKKLKTNYLNLRCFWWGIFRKCSFGWAVQEDTRGNSSWRRMTREHCPSSTNWHFTTWTLIFESRPLCFLIILWHGRLLPYAFCHTIRKPVWYAYNLLPDSIEIEITRSKVISQPDYEVVSCIWCLLLSYIFLHSLKAEFIDWWLFGRWFFLDVLHANLS